MARAAETSPAAAAVAREVLLEDGAAVSFFPLCACRDADAARQKEAMMAVAMQGAMLRYGDC